MRLSLLLFVIGVVVFAAFSGPRLLIHSEHNHFVYQADALLQGSAEIVRRPHHQNDWASFEVLQLKGKSAQTYGPVVQGFFTKRSGKPGEFRTLAGDDIRIPRRDRGEAKTRTFVSFPPMPAVLMLPSVAVIGYGTNDTVYTVVFAGLNVALAFGLLGLLRRRGLSNRARNDDLWLVVLFAFGSAHLWCAAYGSVWFTALIMGVTFHLAYLYFAIDARRPLLAGLCVAAAFSTRASLLFVALFFYIQLIWPANGQRLPRREIIKRFALFTAPCLVAGGLLLWFNYARFENPLEFGHTYLAGGTLPRIRDYGLFDPHFITKNLKAAFTITPRIVSEAPYLKLTKHGMSLFWTTPALIWLFAPKRMSRLAWQMLGMIVVLLVPLLLYQNTGWEQFGYRFSLDFLPYVLCLLALGDRRLSKVFKTLVIVGVLVNAFGAVTFQRPAFTQFYGGKATP
ncbi:MAG: hypothetical protein ACI9U2_000714 [Bradymonadia bacterium]|jgi:hypothetical protein